MRAAITVIVTEIRVSSPAAAARRSGHHQGQLETGLLVSHVARVQVSMNFLCTNIASTNDAGKLQE